MNGIVINEDNSHYFHDRGAAGANAAKEAARQQPETTAE